MVDKSTQPEAGTSEPTFYIRCAGDGSWLMDTDRHYFQQHPATSPVRLTVEEAEAHGYRRENPIYVHVPTDTSLGERLLTWIRRYPSVTLADVHDFACTQFPVDFKRFEIAGVLNSLLRSGELEIDDRGHFIPGTQNAGLDVINPELFARELNEQLTNAVVALDGAIQGNGDIVSSAQTLVELLRENCQPHGSEPTIIRAFMEGGLLQAVTGLPDDFVLRRIDLDVEGADENATQLLTGDDVPPYVHAQYQKNDIQGFVGEFLPDGSQRRVE